MSKDVAQYSAFRIINGDIKPFVIKVKGRDRWALEALIAAGKNGCTPVQNPAPRWSAYIFNLRRSGIRIETLHEQNKGEFAGTHARYILRSTIERINVDQHSPKRRDERFLPATFMVTNYGMAPFNITIMGHQRWALELLIKADKAGCNPIDHRLPRWFENIIGLRTCGIHIETLHQGYHTYHILRSKVSQVETEASDA